MTLDDITKKVMVVTQAVPVVSGTTEDGSTLVELVCKIERLLCRECKKYSNDDVFPMMISVLSNLMAKLFVDHKTRTQSRL
jgi:hypothetical protein